MNAIKYFKVTAVALLCGIVAFAQDASDTAKKSDQALEAKQALFEKLVGKWQGPDGGMMIRGEITKVIDGEFLRHTYETLQKYPRHGEVIIGFNSVTNQYQVSGVDILPRKYAIMFSEGSGVPQGFTVRGECDTGPGKPREHWRIEYKLIDDDHLTITGYRISSGGKEIKEMEIKYERIEKRATK